MTLTLELLLLEDEGMRLMPYTDSVGVLTIGVGRAIGRVGISTGEALHLLRNDITHMRKGLASALPWYLSLSPLRQLVLESMAFNLGVTGLMKFKATLAAIQSGDYNRAADQMMASKWARQTKGRALRLAAMMRDDREEP